MRRAAGAGPGQYFRLRNEHPRLRWRSRGGGGERSLLAASNKVTLGRPRRFWPCGQEAPAAEAPAGFTAAEAEAAASESWHMKFVGPGTINLSPGPDTLAPIPLSEVNVRIEGRAQHHREASWRVGRVVPQFSDGFDSVESARAADYVNRRNADASQPTASIVVPDVTFPSAIEAPLRCRRRQQRSAGDDCERQSRFLRPASRRLRRAAAWRARLRARRQRRL